MNKKAFHTYKEVRKASDFSMAQSATHLITSTFILKSNSNNDA
ncbi:hypothetical protein [Segatella maculosa]|nr:hypothetical protein [Segatella maculosa]